MPKFRHLCSLLLLLNCVTPLTAFSQDVSQKIKAIVAANPAVKFSDEVKEELGTFTSISNAVFKPKGEGPFPAVVLVHTCGGVDNSHMRKHGQEMLKAGYVVLLQDSYGPRGISTCRKTPISPLVGVNDAYAALAHLSKFSFVDKNRIYEAGYSWGAMVATLLASPSVATAIGTNARFRATVSNYSTCKKGDNTALVSMETDRPLLMLMGEKDTELPPSSCFPMLEEMKAAGRPVSWYVFPNATHGWDKVGEGRNGYSYSDETTMEANKRLLDFFEANR